MENEKRNQKNADLDRIKQIEVEILKELIAICQKLNLKYYIWAGTLLGAVRHKGMIPWDDDIDVAMFRPDYEVFIKEAPRYLSEHLFLQTHGSDPNYLNSYAKIRDNNTTFIETVVKDVPMHHGIFIDIFPLDYCSQAESEKNRFKRQILQERINADFFPNERRSAVGKLVTLFSRLCYSSAEEAFWEREKLNKSTVHGEYVRNHTWQIRENMPIAWYGEGTILDFEGLQVNAPKEYEKCLKYKFGDYMQLPPVEKRISRHPAEIIDTENSYLQYVNG